MNAEIEVTVEIHTKKEVKVTNGFQSAWVPYNIIDEDSEVYEKTPVGSSATLVIPFDVALNLGLI